MLRAVRAGSVAPEPEVGAAADVLAVLRTRGACFRPELAPLTGRLPAEVDEGLWDLVARGLVTADAFSAVRALLSARDRWRTRTVRRPQARLARRRAPVGTGIGEGRWSLLPGPEVLGVPAVDDGVLSPGNEDLAESVARQLLVRWGVVAWELWGRESFKVPWREVVWALRRMEARGVALGGRFVAGLSGEQYALPEAVEELQRVHRRRPEGEQVVVAGADPLNMTGTIVGGARVPTRRHQRVVYRDGVVVELQAV
jgi:ATP-dependent Lhr-like helicase